MAAERAVELPVENVEIHMVVTPDPDVVEHDVLASRVVEELNRRNEKRRLEKFTEKYGDMPEYIGLVVEERVFDEEQRREGDGLDAQLRNTFGYNPLRRGPFGI